MKTQRMNLKGPYTTDNFLKEKYKEAKRVFPVGLINPEELFDFLAYPSPQDTYQWLNQQPELAPKIEWDSGSIKIYFTKEEFLDCLYRIDCETFKGFSRG